MKGGLNLKYDLHSRRIETIWRDLILECSDSDVTLICEDQTQFKVSKFILISCSSLFETILTDHPNPNPIIHLGEVSPQTVQSILELVSLGEVRVGEDEVEELLRTVSDLDISRGSVSSERCQTARAEENGEDDRGLVRTEGKKNIEHQNIVLKNEEGGDEMEIREDPTDIGDDQDENNELKILKKEILELMVEEEVLSDEKIPSFEDEREETKIAEKLSVKKKIEKEFDDTSAKLKKEKKKRNKRKMYLSYYVEGDFFVCDKCGFKCKRKDAHINHYKYHHEGIKFLCELCPALFKNRRYLERHLRSLHEGVKYPCTKCDYQARQECNLRIHMQSVHEGTRYQCPFCTFEATRKGHLKTHVKKAHPSQGTS